MKLADEVGAQAGLKSEKPAAARYRGNSAQQTGEYGRGPSWECCLERSWLQCSLPRTASLSRQSRLSSLTGDINVGWLLFPVSRRLTTPSSASTRVRTPSR